MEEQFEHRKRMEILERHMGKAFYKTGEFHNAISDAMAEYAMNGGVRECSISKIEENVVKCWIPPFGVKILGRI